MGSSMYGRRVTIRSLLWYKTNKTSLLPTTHRLIHFSDHQNQILTFFTPNTPFSSHFSPIFTPFSSIPTSIITSLRNLSTTSNDDVEQNYQSPDGTDEEVEPIDSWEEEDTTEPEIGDGADGGGIALQNCPWGESALSIAREVLLEFDDDIQLYAFKTSPRGYIYVRLDKLSHEYGCPSMEEIESYSRRYKKRLDEFGASGEMPDDLALEVSSPSAERLLRVPDDLHRFKDMPMRVSYVNDVEGKCQENTGVFLLDLINIDTGTITWRLANVKDNRDPLAKGRPMSRKQKDWRLELPFTMFKRVTLYLDY